MNENLKRGLTLLEMVPRDHRRGRRLCRGAEFTIQSSSRVVVVVANAHRLVHSFRMMRDTN